MFRNSNRAPVFVAAVLGLIAFAWLNTAQAQAAPDVAFTINAVSQGPGKAVPTLTWNITGGAPTCSATGWSGTSGTLTGSLALAVVTANKNYALSCTFAADTQAAVSWNAVTTNADGSPLTDLASYNVYWNTGDPSLVTAPGSKVRSVPPAQTPTTTITGLAPGPWFFAVTAVNATGVESALSNVATKTIGAATVITKNAAIVFPGTVVITVK